MPTCEKQEYLQKVSDMYLCLPCNAQCDGCFGPDDDDCKQCANYNNTINGANECSEFCPSGSYPDSQNVCQACHAQCSGCSGPTNLNCTSCVENQMVLVSGETACVSSCPLWQVYDVVSERCVLSE